MRARAERRAIVAGRQGAASEFDRLPRKPSTDWLGCGRRRGLQPAMLFIVAAGAVPNGRCSPMPRHVVH